MRLESFYNAGSCGPRVIKPDLRQSLQQPFIPAAHLPSLYPYFNIGKAPDVPHLDQKSPAHLQASSRFAAPCNNVPGHRYIIK